MATPAAQWLQHGSAVHPLSGGAPAQIVVEESGSGPFVVMAPQEAVGCIYSVRQEERRTSPVHKRGIPSATLPVPAGRTGARAAAPVRGTGSAPLAEAPSARAPLHASMINSAHHPRLSTAGRVWAPADAPARPDAPPATRTRRRAEYRPRPVAVAPVASGASPASFWGRWHPRWHPHRRRGRIPPPGMAHFLSGRGRLGRDSNRRPTA
jgi:hypothetical protein